MLWTAPFRVPPRTLDRCADPRLLVLPFTFPLDPPEREAAERGERVVRLDELRDDLCEARARPLDLVRARVVVAIGSPS